MSAVKMGLTIEEAAECTGIGRNTMRKLVDWGKLPVLKVGRKAIIRRDTLERFMAVNQGRNLLREGDVRRGVHGHADHIHAPGRIGYSHPSDNILRVLVQQVVQRRHGAALADNDGNHSHTGLHTRPSLYYRVVVY